MNYKKFPWIKESGFKKAESHNFIFRIDKSSPPCALEASSDIVFFYIWYFLNLIEETLAFVTWIDFSSS